MGASRLAVWAALLALGHLQAAAAWKLLWSDEFNGKTLSRRKWDYEIGTGCQYLSGEDKWPMCSWGNAEQQYYSFSNVEVQAGRLVIEARKEPDGTLTSARIHTRGKFSVAPTEQWRTIRIEARMLLPQGAGLWPAFWLLPSFKADKLGYGKYGMWAYSGEIDIMESKNEMGMVWGTIHFGASWPGNSYLGGFTGPSRAPFHNRWHTYALEWDLQGEMRWYVDGSPWPYFTARSGGGRTDTGGWFSTAKNAAGRPTAPFNEPFHIIFNLALGGHYTGVTDRNVVSQTLEGGPKKMLVDWVRVHGRE